MSFEGTEGLLLRTQDFVDDHRRLYLRSGGAQGHIVDFSHAGVARPLPTLLLKTVGRRSGRTLVTPLIYGVFREGWVVIGSKGGALAHPAWFLNLQARPEVEFQVATQAFQAQARILEGEAQASAWTYMEGLYPPYTDYLAAAGGREIPVVSLSPLGPAPAFSEV